MFAYNFADVTNVGHAGDTQGPADYNALVNSVKRAIANNFPNS